MTTKNLIDDSKRLQELEKREIFFKWFGKINDKMIWLSIGIILEYNSSYTLVMVLKGVFYGLYAFWCFIWLVQVIKTWTEK